MKIKFLYRIFLVFAITIAFGCEKNDIGEIDPIYTCRVDTVSFKESSIAEVTFLVSLGQDISYHTVEEEYIMENNLITIGNELVFINNFVERSNSAIFDFYYGENLGPFCQDLFSAIPIHTHDAFRAEAERVISGKVVGKWKIRKTSKLSSNRP